MTSFDDLTKFVVFSIHSGRSQKIVFATVTGAEGEEGEDAPMEVDEGEGEVLVVTDSEDEEMVS